MAYSSGALPNGNCGFSRLEGGVLHCGPAPEAHYLRLGIENTWLTFYANICGKAEETVHICLHWPKYQRDQNVSENEWRQKVAPFEKVVSRLIYISKDEINWERINAVADTKNDTTFSVTLDTNGSLFVSVGLPYTYKMYEGLIRDTLKSPFVSVEDLGPDYCGAPVSLFVCTNRAIENTQKKAIWYQSLQHPQEPLGGLAADGMIRYLMKDEARPLLDKYIFYVLPVFSVWDWMHAHQTHLSRINPNRDWIAKELPIVRAVDMTIRQAMARGERFALSFDVHTGIGDDQDINVPVSSIDVQTSEEIQFAEILISMCDYFHPGAMQIRDSTNPTMFEGYARRLGIMSFSLELSRYNLYSKVTGKTELPSQPKFALLGRDWLLAIDSFLHGKARGLYGHED